MKITKGSRVEVHGLAGVVSARRGQKVDVWLDQPVYGGRLMTVVVGAPGLVVVAVPTGRDDRTAAFAALRKMGFRRECTSGASAYYRLGLFTVRVSDHEVPLTGERSESIANGGKSWANNRWSFVVGSDDLTLWLAEVAEQINQEAAV